jgi:hypothetical protein
MTSHPPSNNPPYEVSDANVKQISIWTSAIFITMAAALVAMAALLFGFLKFPVPLDPPPTAAEYERILPPTPRLQVNQAGDLQQFRVHEEHALTTYGREHNSGAVHIPIDKAIDIVAARGVLPGTSKPTAKPAVKK